MQRLLGDGQNCVDFFALLGERDFAENKLVLKRLAALNIRAWE